METRILGPMRRRALNSAASGLVPSHAAERLTDEDSEFLERRGFSQPSLYSQVRTMRMDTGAKRLTNPFEQHAIVYACVHANASNIASTPFRVRPSSDPQGPADDGPFADLFDDPNPLCSTAAYFYIINSLLDLTGGCIVVKEGREGRVESVDELPAELWPLSQDLFTPIIDPDTKLPAYWVLHKDSPDQIVYKPHEVLTIQLPNPFDRYRGLAPLKAAMATLDMDWAARNYNASFLKNGGNPSGILSTQEKLNPKDRDDIRKEWEDQYTGEGKQRRTAVLDKSMTYQSFADSHREMEYTGQLELDRYEIMAVFRVPPAEAGFYENVNYSTATVEAKRYWQRTLVPRMALIEDAHWSQMFKYVEGGRKVGLFDRSAVPELQEGLSEKLDALERLVAAGWTVQQAAASVGLGDMRINPWQRVAWTDSKPSTWADHYSETMKQTMPPSGGDTFGGGDFGSDDFSADTGEDVGADAGAPLPDDGTELEPVSLPRGRMVTRSDHHQIAKDRYLTPFVRSCEGVLRRTLLKYRSRAMAAAANGKPVELARFMADLSAGLKAKYHELALQRSAHVASDCALPARRWRAEDGRVNTLARTHLARLASFGDAIADALKSAEAGEPAKRVELVRTVFASAMSATKRVAWAEAYALANRAGFLTMIDLGVKAHGWRTSTCPVCKARDEVVEVGAPFECGLAHPYDPAEETPRVGCTCLTTPRR